MNVRRVKRFLLFTALIKDGRKDYVSSFDSRQSAIGAAEKLSIKTQVNWQVMDNQTAKIVAADPEPSP